MAHGGGPVSGGTVYGVYVRAEWFCIVHRGRGCAMGQWDWGFHVRAAWFCMVHGGGTVSGGSGYGVYARADCRWLGCWGTAGGLLVVSRVLLYNCSNTSLFLEQKFKPKCIETNQMHLGSNSIQACDQPESKNE